MKKIFFALLFLSLLLTQGQAAKKHIVVNLADQTATAFEDGRAVFSGRISTGKSSTPTPSPRTWRVISKDIDHVSSRYPEPNGGAKMHYMLGLTGYGIAMHLGFVPDYPASHGCIRLENGFAQKMYFWARVGIPVYVRGTAPRRVYRAQPKKEVIKKKKPVSSSLAMDILSSSPKMRTSL